MKRCGLIPALALTFPLALTAQVPRTVQSVGSATIQAQPDQVKVDLGVTTVGNTATDAANQNATQMTAVISAVQQVLGPNTNVPTISYSITPNYRPNSSPPQVVSYTATNMIEVTAPDAKTIARVIDSTAPAGVTTITGLRFTVSDDGPIRQQALAAAAKEALAHATAIASGLGAHIGNVLAAEEGVTVTPLVRGDLTPNASAASTPIQPGLVSVSASVTISVELTP